MFLLLGFLAQLLTSCNVSSPQVEIAKRKMADSIFNAEKSDLTILSDSLCQMQFNERLKTMSDSIFEVRKNDMLKKLKARQPK